MCFGGDVRGSGILSSRQVEPQGHTEGAAPGQYERGEVNLAHLIAALGQDRANAGGRLCHHYSASDADRVYAKGGSLVRRCFDQQMWRDTLMDASQRGGGECQRKHKHLTSAEGAKAGIEMIKAWGGQFQRHGVAAEKSRDLARGGLVGTEAEARPKQLARCVPDRVAGAFLHLAGRKFGDFT